MSVYFKSHKDIHEYTSYSLGIDYAINYDTLIGIAIQEVLSYECI